MNKKGTPETLRTPTSKEAKEMQKKICCKKEKKNTAKRKLMSQIYAEFLAREYDIKNW